MPEGSDMKEQFINRNSLSKTLQFSLLPKEKTEYFFMQRKMLETDKKRAKEYELVKGYIDRYHKAFIESVLSKFILDGVQEYAELYLKSNKADSDKDEMEAMETKMRKAISNALTKDKRYKLLDKKEFIREILPEYLTDPEELKAVSSFYDFSTYFKGFSKNRENMYSPEAKSTAISYRCINENLPKFIDNVKSFEKVIGALPEENLAKLNEDFDGLYGLKAEDVFSLDYFSFVLAQSGIEKYNSIIGGYSNSDGSKIQGINEYINLYNQQVSKTDKTKRLPFMKPLYKQILSDRETVSFILEEFEDDNQLLKAVFDFYNDEEHGVRNTVEKIVTLIESISEYDTDGIYMSSPTAITELSKAVFGDWSLITDNWKKEYELNNPKGKNLEKYYEKQDKILKNKSFSINEIQELGSNEHNVCEYFAAKSQELKKNIDDKYSLSKELLSNEYTEKKRLAKNDEAIEKIKSFLDSIKDLERLAKSILGTGKEENKDNTFYGEFLPCVEHLKTVDNLYNKVRNYLTKKPYSTDKIKLNFDNPQLLGGWDKNKERDYRTVILRDGENYFLAVIDKNNSKALIDAPKCTQDLPYYEKMVLKLLPDPSKMLPKVFFATKNLNIFCPSAEIMEIRKTGSYKKGETFNIDDCHKFIDFYKESINKHDDWKNFNFVFSDTEKYEDISAFFREVSEQGYKLGFENISKDYVDKLVDNGSIYLFQIYNKDFSKYSKGKPNLHTLYFKMLFDERNLKDVVYKLSGEAEMFYRVPSINKDEMVVHHKNQPIDNKNPNNERKQSTFEYDLIKDRRFTKPQFSIHIPITLNYKANGKGNINYDVREILKESDSHYIIGIDRGERNLIYICVIDENGTIVEQRSFNIIKSDNDYEVDYHQLLDKREKERDEAKKSWKTVGNIKELKEGYISQVVHKICKLVVKYDAVIALEDLNSGFINSRKKVDKQVYQKFENMLVTKLNYLVDKSLDANENGGLLKAYQLTNPLDEKNRKSRQNGIIFYVPAWLTSKIDPVTGFVSLIKPRYISINTSVEFIDKFDDIRYNSDNDLFEFDLDYTKFEKCNADYKKQWTVCTNGERIKTFRNSAKNNEWDNQTVVLTDEFKSLFEQFGIDYHDNLKSQILEQNSKDFFEQLMRLISLTLQMRNSITGNVDVDYLISPVRNSKGEFYDSRNYKPTDILPCDADANGAYNIARKALWAIKQLKQSDDVSKVKLSISKKEWLEYAQSI